MANAVGPMNLDEARDSIAELRASIAYQNGRIRAMHSLLERMTSATSISQFHGLLCEAKELLGTRGVTGNKHQSLLPSDADTSNPRN